MATIEDKSGGDNNKSVTSPSTFRRRNSRKFNRMLPPVVLRMIHFKVQDKVQTPFGNGKIEEIKIISAPSTNLYKIALTLDGSVAYCQSGYVMPLLAPVNKSDYPAGTAVRILSLDKIAKVVSTIEDQVQVEHNMNNNDKQSSSDRIWYPRTDLCIANGVTVCTPGSKNGQVKSFDAESGNYTVEFEDSTSEIISSSDVSPADMRLLAYLPKPMSASAIMKRFKGKITQEQANAASAAASNAFDTISVFCQQNTSLLTQGQASFNQAVSLTDPEFRDAAKRVEITGKQELQKLKSIANDMKSRLQDAATHSDVLKDSKELASRSKNILNEIGTSAEARDLISQVKKQLGEKFQKDCTSTEELLNKALALVEEKVYSQSQRLDAMSKSDSLMKALEDKRSVSDDRVIAAKMDAFALERFGVSIAALDPIKVLENAQELLPSMTEKATGVLQNYEKYFVKMQDGPNGKALVEKAKAYVTAAETNGLKHKITSAMADVNVKQMADWGEALAQDSMARQDFADNIKDKSLDFLLDILPSIKIPPISGMKDEIQYSISGLDLSKFALKKEKVFVKLGKIGDEEILRIRAANITAHIPNFDWSFVQKKFPFLNGGGKADATLTGGSISLSFRAEKRNDTSGNLIKPTLALSSILIEVKEDLKINILGSWFSAAYNLLATIFAEQIRDYITSTLESNLIDHMNQLINPLNAFLDKGSSYWPELLGMSGVKSLPEAPVWRGATRKKIGLGEVELSFTVAGDLGMVLEKSHRTRHAVVSKLKRDEEGDDLKIPVGNRIVAINGYSVSELTVKEVRNLIMSVERPITLRFSSEATNPMEEEKKKKRFSLTSLSFDEGPLGLKLRPRPLCDTGAIVSGFLPLSDGRAGPAQKSGKVSLGQLILRLNDEGVVHMPFKRVLEKLKSLPRPVTIVFAENSDGVVKMNVWPPAITLSLSPLGQVILTGFKQEPYPTVISGELPVIGDSLYAVNGKAVEKGSYHKVMEVIDEALKRFGVNLTLSFQKSDSNSSSVSDVVVPPGPLGMKFGRGKRNEIVLKAYVPCASAAERSQLLYPGLELLQICTKEIPSPADLDTVESMISDAKPPYSLTIRDLEVYEELLQVA